MELATRSQIPKEVADIFSAPSDDEEFVGFQDDVPMQNLSESCGSLDSRELEKQNVCFRSKYFTEELRRIFKEDTDSEMEDFEGFTESELNMSSNPELMESELSDSDKAYPVMNDAEEDDEEEAAPRRGRSTRRSSFGLRVAFQFPTKKLARTPDKDSSHLLDSKTDLRRKKSSRQPKGKEDSASDAEDESRAESQENSDALLKRAMNIKENKAMLAQLLAELKGSVAGGAVYLVYDQELLGPSDKSEAALRKAEEVVPPAMYQFSQYVCQQTGLEMPQLPTPPKIKFPNFRDSWNSGIISVMSALSVAPSKAREYSKEGWEYLKEHSK